MTFILYLLPIVFNVLTDLFMNLYYQDTLTRVLKNVKKCQWHFICCVRNIDIAIINEATCKWASQFYGIFSTSEQKRVGKF